MSISFLMVYFLPNYFGLIFIFIIYYLRGVVTPLLKNQININTTSNVRATVMSVRSFVLRISFAIVAPILGYLADNNGLEDSYLILSVLIICVSTISVIGLKKGSELSWYTNWIVCFYNNIISITINCNTISTRFSWNIIYWLSCKRWNS